MKTLNKAQNNTTCIVDLAQQVVYCACVALPFNNVKLDSSFSPVGQKTSAQFGKRLTVGRIHFARTGEQSGLEGWVNGSKRRGAGKWLIDRRSSLLWKKTPLRTHDNNLSKGRGYMMLHKGVGTKKAGMWVIYNHNTGNNKYRRGLAAALLDWIWLRVQGEFKI